MANSLYIASIEPESGKSIVALGIMEMLSRRVGRVGYFRPIIPTALKRDNDIELIRQRYHLDRPITKPSPSPTMPSRRCPRIPSTRAS